MIINKDEILEDITFRHGVPYKDIEQTDPCIVPALILLNELGYKTKYSCQGHRRHEKAYIMFDDDLGESELKSLFESLCYVDNQNKNYSALERNPLFFIDSGWDAIIWIRVVQNNEVGTNAILEVREVNNSARLKAILILTSNLFTLCFENALLSKREQKLKNYCKSLIQEMEECLT